MTSAIKGVTVVLYKKTQSGTDDFNQPVWTETETEVPNVLVEPASDEAVVSELEVNGKHISYILHIPKEDTNSWKDVRIKLPEPWNITVRSYGNSLVYDPEMTPLDWNRKVKVELYE